MDFQILLAGKVIRLHTLYEMTCQLCRDYLCEAQEPDFSVEITESDLIREKELSAANDLEEGRDPVRYGEDYLETLAVYRKIADQMIRYDTFLMHGAVVTAGALDEAVMFTAESGVGKTTRSRMWLKNVPGSCIINGDKPLLKVTESEVFACGTPWAGKEQLQTNRMVPLRAVLLLERSEENRIEEAALHDVLPVLLSQVYRSERQEGFLQTMKLLSRMGKQVKFYRYHSNLEDEAIEIACREIYGTSPSGLQALSKEP